MEISGAEHKPGKNGNVGSAVKQRAEITGHDIHPNYANVLETGVNNKNRRLFLESLHSFQEKNSVNERAPFPRFYASLVVLHIYVNNNVLHICILLPLAESTLKKTAEGGRKFSCFFFNFRSGGLLFSGIFCQIEKMTFSI